MVVSRRGVMSYCKGKMPFLTTLSKNGILKFLQLFGCNCNSLYNAMITHIIQF